MKIWNRVRGAWQSLPWLREAKKTAGAEEAGRAPGDAHLELARESLRDLLADTRVPEPVRRTLADDYAQVEAMLDKLEHGYIHIAAFGRVSVGKSSVLNALLGQEAFTVSPLHGETRRAQMRSWQEYASAGVFFIDTPGINEVAGEERERLAREVVSRVDLVLFIADGDLTDSEVEALRDLTEHDRPVVCVLNKADRYTDSERPLLREAVVARTAGLVDPANVIFAAARPAPATYVIVNEAGEEREECRPREPDVSALRGRLWDILELEGKTLAALSAGLFAGRLSEQVARRILAARRALGERVVRTYCIGKGVAVALNPVPVADLAAAAVIDGTMVWHLSRLYDLPVTRTEAGTLVRVIITQLAALMGTVWAVHLGASALKLGTGGLSTFVTAGAQGAVAYYSTYVVGRVAEEYLAQGKSWGEGGPKQVAQEILDSLDRDSVLAQARLDIKAHLRGVPLSQQPE